MSDTVTITVAVAVVVIVAVVVWRLWLKRPSQLLEAHLNPRAKSREQQSGPKGTDPVDDKHIVDYPACHGTLSWDENGNQHHAAISFGLRVDQAGDVHLIIEDQPLTNDNSWINHAFSGSSPVVASLNLEGRNKDGLVLHSDSVHLTSIRTQSTQNAVTLQLRGQAQQLTAVAANGAGPPVQEYQAEYWIAGLQWYRSTTFTVAEGEIAIGGGVQLENYSEVTGTVAIRSPAQERSLGSWTTEANAVVQRVLDVVSFADGHFMRPSVRQVFKDKKLVHVDFLGKGQGSPPYKPPLHCLNFTNSLPPLIQAYTQDLIDRTGINVAIEWHLMPHLYNEARFVSQMTAIEHLIHVFSEQSPDSTYINKSTFNKSMAPVVIKTLEQELANLHLNDAEREDAIRGMTQGLKGINRRSLRSNLDRMIRIYQVPLDGLQDSIKPLIEMRNAIVHRGLSTQDGDDSVLGQRVAEAEELLRRIILALLGFRGRYTSWLNKIEDRDFQINP